MAVGCGAKTGLRVPDVDGGPEPEDMFRPDMPGVDAFVPPPPPDVCVELPPESPPKFVDAQFLARIATAELEPASAAELYERVFPALKSRTSLTEQSWDPPNRTAREFVQAEIDYARLQIALGDQAAAEFFLDDALEFTRLVPRMGRKGFGTLDAEIAAVRGDSELAAKLLNEAYDAGWVANWWWTLRYNANLSSLHERDDYRRLIEQLESKMRRQRAELD